MENIRYANAMTEVLEYLKGIRQEDIDKIPKKLILFFKENASTNYICNIDYNRPLKEQQLLDETRGLISMLCLNYWCETEEQKKIYINRLSKNEAKYQEELREKYNPNEIFLNRNTKSISKESIQENTEELSLVEIKQKTIIEKIIDKIKKIFRR